MSYEITKVIKQEQIKKGWLRADLAKALNVGEDYTSTLIYGKNKGGFTVGFLYDISKVFREEQTEQIDLLIKLIKLRDENDK